MAKVWLRAELVELLQGVQRSLAQAARIVNAGERNVQAAVKAKLAPADVNRIGDDAWESAGKIIAQSITDLSRLRANEVTGLRFPRIAKFGSPQNYTMAHIDTNAGDTKTHIVAVNQHDDNDTTQDPWDALIYGPSVNGEKVHINGPINIDMDDAATHTLSNIILELDGLVTDPLGSSKPAIEFTTKLYDGTAAADAAEPGTDIKQPTNFEIRTVDDGEAETSSTTTASIDITTDSSGDSTDYTGALVGDIIGVLVRPSGLTSGGTFAITTEYGNIPIYSGGIGGSDTFHSIEDAPVTVANERVEVVTAGGGNTVSGSVYIIYRQQAGLGS